MASFRDRFFTPKVAHAITSPSAILATGAGAAAGILAFGNPVGAIALGLGAFAVRVLAAVPRSPRREGVDLRQLRDPWHSIMVEILDADRRFDRAVAGIRPGPLRDRIAEVGDRLGTAVDEAWKTAQAGQSLSNARAQIDGGRIHAELAAARGAPPTERSAATIAAIESQLAAAQRMDHTIADAYDRLRLLDARIDETVTRAIELSVTQSDVESLDGLGDEVDSIVGDMEALRQAVEETRAAGSTSAPPPMPGTATS
jgi:hypothetical protein